MNEVKSFELNWLSVELAANSAKQERTHAANGRGPVEGFATASQELTSSLANWTCH